MSKLLLISLITCLLGCASDNPDNAQENNLSGSDKDEYGCIGSAGYTWCERTKQCERPWELAEQGGFENSQEAFQEYCRDAAL